MSRRTEIKESRQKDQIKTGIAIFDDHYGFQKGKVHLLMARLSSGKSTTVRSLLKGVCSNHKAFLLCTEETQDDVIDGFGRLNDDEAALIEQNLRYRSEQDLPKDIEGYFEFISTRILETESEMFVLDNLTASRMYGALRPADQNMFSDKIFDLARLLNIPVLVIGHTSKDIRNNDFTVESVRGIQSISIKAEYAYTLHSDMISIDLPGRPPTEYMETWVRVAKSRHHPESLGSTYKLQWDPNKKLFSGAVKSPINDFNSFIRPRRQNAKKPSASV